MSRVHLGTTVQAVFGIVDEDGNVIADEPITLQVHKFSPAAFEDAYDTIVGERDRRAAAAVNGTAASEPAQPNRATRRAKKPAAG